MQPTTGKMVGATDFYTYAYLFHAACSLFKSAKEQAAGSNHCRTAAALFSAFAIEACLNHVGAEKVPSWNTVERKLSRRGRLKRIAREIQLIVDDSKRPFSTLETLFRLRDNLAHGKTEIVQGTIEEMDPQWLRDFFTDGVIEQVLTDTKQIIMLVLEKAGFPPESHKMISSGMYYEEDA